VKCSGAVLNQATWITNGFKSGRWITNGFKSGRWIFWSLTLFDVLRIYWLFCCYSAILIKKGGNVQMGFSGFDVIGVLEIKKGAIEVQLQKGRGNCNSIEKDSNSVDFICRWVVGITK
jgi:hypothetical protein